MRMVLWLAMATGAGAGRPADSAAAAQRHICGMWPKPGTQGCDGLLRIPLAQDNATREALGAKMAAALRRGKLTIVPADIHLMSAMCPMLPPSTAHCPCTNPGFAQHEGAG